MKKFFKTVLFVSLLSTLAGAAFAQEAGVVPHKSLALQAQEENSFNSTLEKVKDGMRYNFNANSSFGLSLSHGVKVGLRIGF
ncbi:MAG: hypothetical protein U1F57_07985 [bacterium]